MLVVSRFRPADGDAFLLEGRALLELLAARPGFRSGRVARSADEPGEWVLVTEWESAGSWRRSTSPFEVKVAATRLFLQAVDEPSVHEVLVSVDAGGPLVDGLSLRTPTDEDPAVTG